MNGCSSYDANNNGARRVNIKNSTSYATLMWMICFPQGMELVWAQILNHIWSLFFFIFMVVNGYLILKRLKSRK